MNVVDSSGWLEYFGEGPNADFFAPAIEDLDNLLVPVICVYEVFKRILLMRGFAAAEVRIADLYKGNVLELNASLALSAGKSRLIPGCLWPIVLSWQPPTPTKRRCIPRMSTSRTCPR